MHFVIFIPGADGYDACAHLRGVGLDSLIDDCLGPATQDATLAGQPGRLIVWRDDVRTDHNAREGVEGKEWWWDCQRRFAIGWDELPTPDDLLRVPRYTVEPMMTSFPVTLGEHVWQVPLARLLPRKWSQGADGRPVLETAKPFAWYFDAVAAMVQRIAGGEFSPDEPPADCFELAVRALALNYRLCPEVVYAMELIAAADAPKIIAAAAEHSLEFEATVHYDVRARTPLADPQNQTVANERFRQHAGFRDGRDPDYAPTFADVALAGVGSG